MNKRSAGIASGPLCFGEQGVERFSEFGFKPDADAVVVVGQDQDAFEERLVEQSADVFRGADVGGVAVGREVEGQPEVALDGFPLLVRGIELGLDAGEALADAVLLLAEEVNGDRSGVVGLHEFAALAGQLLLTLLELGSAGLDVVACGGELVAEVGFDVVAERGIDLDPEVEVFDFAFDLVDQDRALGASGALGVPSGAEEVRVHISAG